MKNIKMLIIAAAVTAVMGGCSDNNKPSEVTSSAEETTTAAEAMTTVPETTTAAVTTTAPKKSEITDFYGKWVPVKIIEGEDVHELYYNEVPLDQIFQLEISKDGTASIGSGFPDSETKQYTWEFKGRIIKLSGDSEIYGGIKEDHLILTNAEGLKIYMESADEFSTMDEAVYEALTEESGGEIVIPELCVNAEESTAEDYIGKWECSYYEVDGEVFKDEIYGVPLKALFQMEIMDDNTAQFRAGGTDEDAVATEYTWELDSSRCIEFYEDDELVSVAQIKNGELYLDEGADITHFRSVKKFSDFDWNSLAAE